MYDVPWETHRYFMEPLTGLPHTSRCLAKRYFSFIQKIQNSNKTALKNLLTIVQSDVRHIAGFNLRTLMLLAEKTSIVHMHRLTLLPLSGWFFKSGKEIYICFN
jgi:hypothetical protein